MAKLKPVSWQELVKRLNELGFENPFSGGKHPQMRRANVTLIIPNPHKKEITVGLLQRILRQAEISREECRTYAEPPSVGVIHELPLRAYSGLIHNAA